MIILRAALSGVLALAALVQPILGQSAGCGKQAGLANGVQTINGRQYTLRIPSGYNSSTRYKLIFGLHWLGGNMNDVVNGNSVQPWYGLESRAQGSAVFVAPNGLDNGWANTNGRDVALIDSIITAVENALCIDQSQRFATGFSYGGGMSYALACARATQFRAVSVLSGGLISGCSGGTNPIAYLGIHGINDNVLNFQGGVNLANKFIQNNKCQSATVERPAAGSRSSKRTDFKGCSRPVSFIAYDGGHEGAPLGRDNSLAPDATWNFFKSA